MSFEDTITLTFGERAENHRGMQVLGTTVERGFLKADLLRAQKYFTSLNCECQLIDLNEFNGGVFYDKNAFVLIAKCGVDALLDGYDKDDLYTEQKNLSPDTKALMYGRVVNKKARHNLCFDDVGQDANYEEGRGTVVAYESVPLLDSVRRTWGRVIGPKANNLKIEGNYYYDTTKCFIGYHGDTERKRVIAIRLGATFPLYYQWYHMGCTIGERLTLNLDHGDIYIMGEKAVGSDWKKKTQYTLRHAAGFQV